MRRITVSLIVLFAIAVNANYGSAQEPAPKPATPTASSESQRPKNAVEQAMEDAKSRGETVMETCVDNCDDFDRESDGRLERGRAIRLPKPDYPAIARRAHAEGEVQVQVLIDFDGTVIAAASISGHPLLQATSVTAARETLFTPTKYDGKPVKVVGVLLYNFVR